MDGVVGSDLLDEVGDLPLNFLRPALAFVVAVLVGILQASAFHIILMHVVVGVGLRVRIHRLSLMNHRIVSRLIDCLEVVVRLLLLARVQRVIRDRLLVRVNRHGLSLRLVRLLLIGLWH